VGVASAGKINLVSLALLGAVAAGIYWVFIFSPPYLDNLDVKEALNAAYNQAGRSTDAQLRAQIRAKLNDPKLGSHEQLDGFGNVRVVGGLGILDEQIVIERDEVSNWVQLRVEYEREIRLRPTERTHTLYFSPHKEGPLRAP
jgi:hypothetical protein